MIHETFIKEATNKHHNIVVMYDTEKLSEDVTMYISITPYNSIWKRIKYAVKYIFTKNTKDNYIESFKLYSKDWKKFQDIADYLKSLYILNETV